MPVVLRLCFVLALLCLLGLATPAQAYIDPNAGGLLFQLLAPLFAAAVGAWLVLRRWVAAWWQRVVGAMKRRFSGRPGR